MSSTTNTNKVPVGIIFGGSLFSAHTPFFGTGYTEPTTEELGPIFDKIKKLDIPIDTARLYPEVRYSISFILRAQYVIDCGNKNSNTLDTHRVKPSSERWTSLDVASGSIQSRKWDIRVR